jgi:hypothetical protein
MKITASVDELLAHFPNLSCAVSILIQGVNEKRYGALYDWDEFRKKDAAQNTMESTNYYGKSC